MAIKIACNIQIHRSCPDYTTRTKERDNIAIAAHSAQLKKVQYGVSQRKGQLGPRILGADVLSHRHRAVLPRISLSFSSSFTSFSCGRLSVGPVSSVCTI